MQNQGPRGPIASPGTEVHRIKKPELNYCYFPVLMKTVRESWNQGPQDVISRLHRCVIS